VDPEALDPIDRAIIGVLVENGRISWRDLGSHVGLSPNATADRVRRLEQRGVISGYAATIDPGSLGRSLEAIVAVKMHQGFDRESFEAFVTEHDAITGAVHLTGADDYLLDVAARNAGELDDLLTAMKRERGVADTNTRVVLRRIQG
jgi:Lrp/AsnC family leucine-responsive transcriptional regulator